MDSSSSSSRERDQSRICVETIDDWERVKLNFTDAMTGVMDARLGSDSSQEERDILFQHLVQWRDAAFDLAKKNVRVNGINMEDYAENEDDYELEPYDEVLDRRLWTHFKERVVWDKTLADRRRDEPVNGQRLMEDLIMRERAFEAESLPSTLDSDMDVDMESSGAPIDRLDEIVGTHSSVVAALENWKQAAPTLVEKATRVEQVLVADAKLTP